MPGQGLNYIEAHDNYNLNDLMHHLHPHDSPEDIEKRIYLANALNLSMQGMCFMQLGQEFQRSKMVATGGDGNYTEEVVKRAMNSYNAPDEVNRVDWNQVTLKKELIDKIAKLIERKRTVAEFSYRSYADIYDNLYVAKAEYDSGIVELHISGKLRKTFVFNNMKKRFGDLLARQSKNVIIQKTFTQAVLFTREPDQSEGFSSVFTYISMF